MKNNLLLCCFCYHYHLITACEVCHHNRRKLKSLQFSIWGAKNTQNVQNFFLPIGNNREKTKLLRKHHSPVVSFHLTASMCLSRHQFSTVTTPTAVPEVEQPEAPLYLCDISTDWTGPALRTSHVSFSLTQIAIFLDLGARVLHTGLQQHYLNILPLNNTF